jgi:para-aminobenzoate synthetase component I
MEKRIRFSNDIKTEDIVRIFKNEEYFFMLESNRKNDIQSDFTFIGINPQDYIITGAKNENVIEDFNNFYNKYRKGEEKLTFPCFFCFLTYDLGMFFLNVASKFKYNSRIPAGFLGYYPVIIELDERNSKFEICYDSNYEDQALSIKQKIEEYEKDNYNLNLKSYDIIYAEDFESYAKKIDIIKNYIYEGDVYQINYTRRFNGFLENANYNDMYMKLKNTNPAPFSAFIRCNNWAIISSSPERLIKSTGGILETRPIKGTIERGGNFLTEIINKLRLKNSDKDKSELLMIVDLERNDLSRISENGSVRVDELFKIETYETIHHLVSTIRSKIKSGLTPFDVLYRLFPGGSITGTPKKRAVEIIDELEDFPRGIYTGTIGYIKGNGDFDFNIAIRTIVIEENNFNYNVGGGITWKSQTEAEYLETEHKGLGLKRSLDFEL